MAANNDASMSALGSFYDAIFAVAKDQGKKYGQTAAPDFVMGQFNDSLADSMVQVGAMVGANLKVAQSVSDTVTSYATDKLTFGKFNVNQILPLNLGQLFPTLEYDLGSIKPNSEDDKLIGAGTASGLSAEPKIEYSNPNEFVTDTKAAADKAAVAYWDGIKKIQRARLIAGIGKGVQDAAHYWVMRDEGVPNDIAATIANATISTPELRSLDVSVKNDDNRFATDLRRAPVVDYAAAETQAKKVTGSTLAMYSGIADQSQRDEFVNYAQRDLFEEVRREYNNREAASTLVIYDAKGNRLDKAFKPADSFFDVFAQVDPATKEYYLKSKDQKGLFNGADSHGDMLQEAFQKALEKAKSNPMYSASLKANIQNLENRVLNDNEFTELIKTFGNVVSSQVPKTTMRAGNPVGPFPVGGTAATRREITVPSDLTPMVQLGTRNLNNVLRSSGRGSEADAIQAAAARIKFFDGNLTASEKVSYMIDRYSSLPPINQWISAPLLVMGDSKGFQSLINGMGGITGVGPMTATNPVAGINVLGAFGGKNAEKLQLDPDEGKFANGLLKNVYGAPKVNKQTGAVESWDVKGAALQFGKPQFLVSANSNPLQKGAYLAYVYHPVNQIKGRLDGSYYMHQMHIASGFGKMYQDKKIANIFRSSDIGGIFSDPATRAFMKGKSLGSLFADPRDPTNRKGIKALRDHLNTQWKGMSDKGSEAAQNIQRAQAVLRYLEKLKSPGTERVVKVWQTFHKYAGIPAALQKRAIDKAKKFGYSIALRVATKIGAKAAFEAAAAFASAGVSLLFTRTYAVLNFISFGLLDKIVFGAIKLTFEFVAALALAVFAVMLLFGSLLIYPTMSALDYAQVGLFEGGGLWAPDSNYSPVLAASAEAPPDGIGNEDLLDDLKGADGIDVSHWQGNIKWDRVKNAGVQFAIIKASEGTGFVDSEFRKNWRESKSNGIVRSAYHFFRPELDGAAQAEHYLKVVGSGWDFPLSIDVEQPCNMQGSVCVPYSVNKSQSTSNLKKMIDRIKLKTGQNPIIYTSDVMWRLMTTEPSWAGDEYPLWVAAYNNSGPGKLPKGWSDWTIWQYSSNGKIDGISGNVDLDKWSKNGSDDIGGPPSGGDTDYPPDGPGTGETYSGSCQEIFAKVQRESIFSGTKAASAVLVTQNLGKDEWCSSFSEYTVTCSYQDINDWCNNCPNSATRLFRHELTHIARHGSEFCSDLIGEGGGSYVFQAPDLFGDSSWRSAVQLGEAMASKSGLPLSTIRLACVGNSLALMQIAQKGINVDKYEEPEGHRKVSCIR